MTKSLWSRAGRADVSIVFVCSCHLSSWDSISLLKSKLFYLSAFIRKHKHIRN